MLATRLPWWTSAAMVLSIAALPAAAQTTTRVSVASGGGQGNSTSYEPSISSDGRFVAFYSAASNLVPGDTNGYLDVFVHDRASGATTRVSVDSLGGQGNEASERPMISADGRFVVFDSGASNLVPGDTNGFWDVFVHDRASGATTRVSVDSLGGQGNWWSQGNSISADGREVAFWSLASNLVPGDTNGVWDVFVHDRLTSVTTRVSVDSGGGQGNAGSGWGGPSISADGRCVAFASDASNLVPGDTNGFPDVFVHDRLSGATTRVSVDSSGGQGNGDSGFPPSISADGRFVAFRSYASNLVPGDTNGTSDVFVHDRRSGATTRVSVDSGGGQGNDVSRSPAISSDGHYVAFASWASNLVPGDTNGVPDVFVHDRLSGATRRVSVDSGGGQGNALSYDPTISSDGRDVAFWGNASNLVPGDTNGVADVFVHCRLCGVATYCTAKPGLACGLPSITTSGQPDPKKPNGFFVFAGPAGVNKSGLLMYGSTGRNNAPFHGGTLCVNTPIRRTIMVSSGGFTTCDGEFVIDMNAFAAGALGGHPQSFLVTPGNTVDAQWWGRDTPATGAFLSDAVEWNVVP
jgi:Tol biopolymer transport system component